MSTLYLKEDYQGFPKGKPAILKSQSKDDKGNPLYHVKFPGNRFLKDSDVVKIPASLFWPEPVKGEPGEWCATLYDVRGGSDIYDKRGKKHKEIILPKGSVVRIAEVVRADDATRNDRYLIKDGLGNTYTVSSYFLAPAFLRSEKPQPESKPKPKRSRKRKEADDA